MSVATLIEYRFKKKFNNNLFNNYDIRSSSFFFEEQVLKPLQLNCSKFINAS